jgi:chitinase
MLGYISKFRVVKLAVLLFICLILPKLSFADLLVKIPDKIVEGYWHNWAGGQGYKGGTCPGIQLKDIDSRYNVIMVSFMKVYKGQGSNIPTFKLDLSLGMTERQFINQIKILNAQGRLVLISLGGANADIALSSSDEQKFVDEIIRLTDHFGFNGLDIDLEQSAIKAADNKTVIPSALIKIKDHYKKKGKVFVIAMAPEFPHIRKNSDYSDYLTALEKHYDWISPQFYNQGGDGIWDAKYGKFIGQNNDQYKKQFIITMSTAIANGTDGFNKIPHDKLLFGLPSNHDAAANGCVDNPRKLLEALDELEKTGIPLRGIMTWSINWDFGKDSAGKEYHGYFINAYGNYFKQMSKVAHKVAHKNITSHKPKPIITGADTTSIAKGGSFDPMAGVKAKDLTDGDITHKIKVEGEVNTGVANNCHCHCGGNDNSHSVYNLVYIVENSTGEVIRKKRTVHVIDDTKEVNIHQILTPTEEFSNNKQYISGDRVIYKGGIYEAEGSTHNGKTPDSQNSEWKYIGSTLPSELF